MTSRQNLNQGPAAASREMERDGAPTGGFIAKIVWLLVFLGIWHVAAESMATQLLLPGPVAVLSDAMATGVAPLGRALVASGVSLLFGMAGGLAGFALGLLAGRASSGLGFVRAFFELCEALPLLIFAPLVVVVIGDESIRTALACGGALVYGLAGFRAGAREDWTGAWQSATRSVFALMVTLEFIAGKEGLATQVMQSLAQFNTAPMLSGMVVLLALYAVAMAPGALRRLFTAG